MKKFLIFILCLLLTVGAVGGTVALVNHFESEQQTEQPNSDNTDSGSTDSGNTDSGNTDSGSTDDTQEVVELTVPANAASLIQDGLQMQNGASIYVGDDTDRPAIRFSCNVSAELKAELDNDANKSLCFLLAPVDFFDGVNTENYTHIDWVNAFANAGKTVIYSELTSDNFYESGEDYMVRFRLENVLYQNINRKFVCMTVLQTVDGDTTTYKYSSYMDGVTYRSNARSVAYVAAASLNAHTLGLETFDETKLAKLKSYINESVDKANGLETATDDGSMYAFTVTPHSAQSLGVGGTFTVTTTISQDVDVPVWYRSSDEGVVTVDDNGVVKAVGTGTAVIGVYVAGESYGITVTVS